MLKLNYVAHGENRRVMIDICIETLSFLNLYLRKWLFFLLNMPLAYVVCAWTVILPI